MEVILTAIGIKGILLLVLGIWLVFALVKKLVKVAVLAAIILALVYYVYPMVATTLNLK